MNTQMVRTTVYLHKDLVDLAKSEALVRKTSLTGLVESGLEGELGLKKKARKGFKWGGHNLGFKFKKFDRAMAYE